MVLNSIGRSRSQQAVARGVFVTFACDSRQDCHSEFPTCIFTTEVRTLVTKGRDQFLSGAVEVAFGDSAHFGNSVK